MELIVTVLLLGAIAYLVNRWFRKKKEAAGESSLEQEPITLVRTYYLNKVHREIARTLLDDDVDEFSESFNRMRQFFFEVQKDQTNDRRQAELALLNEKYIGLIDFDPFAGNYFFDGTACWTRRTADPKKGVLTTMVERFEDVTKYLLLTSGKNFMFCEHTNNRFHKHVVLKKDRIFKSRLQDAMQRYRSACLGMEIYAKEKGIKEFRPLKRYEDEDFVVEHLRQTRPHRKWSPNLEYGIHCKQTKEYGLHTCFVTLEKSFDSWYRSDPSYEREQTVYDKESLVPNLDPIPSILVCEDPAQV